MDKYWGYHLVLNAKNCEKMYVTNGDHISLFARRLVKEIDMVPFGEPQVNHFGEGNKAGYTLVQLIETSNITGHFCDDSGDVYLDVFSCKPFEANKVISLFDEYFKPESVQHFTIYRDASAKEIRIKDAHI